MPPERPGGRPAIRLDLPPGEESDALRQVIDGSPGLVVTDDGDEADLHVEADPGRPDIWRVTLVIGDGGGRPHEQPSTLRADLAPDDVLDALRLILAGHRIQATGPGALERDGGPAPPSGLSSPILTPREGEVLALLADGASNKVIARRLGISASTTKFHVASVLQKLGAHSRLDAVSIGIRLGLVLI